MELGELLELGAALDDLLLPWPIDLQLRHLIAHEGLVAHIKRAGQLLWERPPNARDPQPTLGSTLPKLAAREGCELRIGCDQHKLLKFCLSRHHAIEEV